jgi:hypothetical protein
MIVKEKKKEFKEIFLHVIITNEKLSSGRSSLLGTKIGLQRLNKA